MEPRQVVFACDRHALGAEKRARHFEITSPKLGSLKKSVNELHDGYRFKFPADSVTFALVSDWVESERLCCPFFEIDLKLDREADALWLCLTGPEGVKQFIRSELFRLFQPE